MHAKRIDTPKNRPIGMRGSPKDVSPSISSADGKIRWKNEMSQRERPGVRKTGSRYKKRLGRLEKRSSGGVAVQADFFEGKGSSPAKYHLHRASKKHTAARFWPGCGGRRGGRRNTGSGQLQEEDHAVLRTGWIWAQNAIKAVGQLHIGGIARAP